MTSILQPTNIINNGKRPRIDLNAIGDVSRISRDTRYGYTDENQNNGNNKKKTRVEIDKLEMDQHHAKQDIINTQQLFKNQRKNKYLSPEDPSVSARWGSKQPQQKYLNFGNPVMNQNKVGTGLSGHPRLYTQLDNKYIPTEPTYERNYNDYEEYPPSLQFAGKKNRKTKRKSLNKRKKTLKKRRNKRKSIKKRRKGKK